MWPLILKHAPAIIAAADALAARVRSGDAGASLRSIGDRVDALEGESDEAATLLQDVARQLNALTLAQQAAARRARTATILAVSAVAVAIGAGILALLR